jgi:hypothetical protein
MYASSITRISNVLLNDADVRRCSAPHKCEEKGKILCLDNSMQFLHIRFDPCMMPDSGGYKPKRCDCVIFGFDQTKKKQAIFVVETKKSYEKGTLQTIQAKIQTCIDRMQRILGGHMNSIEVFPIMCDNKHSALFAQTTMTKYYKVKCYGTAKSILLNSYQKNIVDYYHIAAKKWKNAF